MQCIAALSLTTAFTLSAVQPDNALASEETKSHQSEHTTNKTNLGADNTMAVAWYQNSAEAKALYLQGYNQAKENLKQAIKENKGKHKLAIALDIDETVLDNSPYQGYATLYNKSHPQGWHEWVNAAQAKPVYGAKSFLKYADKQGVDIYYISDRDKTKDFEATQKNLKSQGLPQADQAHIMLKGKSDKSKAPRRAKVQKDHKLVMLFGDNLLDFDDPKKATASSREALIKKHRKDFGKKYIIFPNPMYGSWESTLYHNDYRQSDKAKEQLRKQSIRYFDPSSNQIKQYHS